MTEEQIKLFEKIERCINLIWGLGETYSTVDIDDFVSAELNTYRQHDELFNFIKKLKKQAGANNKDLRKQLNDRSYIRLEEQIVDLEKQVEKMKSDVRKLITDRMNDDLDQNIIEHLIESWE